MVGVLNLANAVFRSSSLHSVSNLRNISIYIHPLQFRATEILLGEPLKKKKKLDPNILRGREERKKKKLQKKIRLLEKHAEHLKPIFEIDILYQQLEKEERARHLSVSLSEKEIERRELLERKWSNYKQFQWLKDVRVMKSIMVSQEIALKELKDVSQQLYLKAIELDDSFTPYSVTGPVCTPPIKDFDSPDGEYIETTVRYIGE